MRIEARVDAFRLPLHEPINTARGTIFAREGLVIVLADEHGHWGRGEVAPLPGWSRIDLTEARSEVMGWADATNRSGHVEEGSRLAPEVRSGIDTALRSLQAAQSGVPLWKSLTDGPCVPEVRVNALIAGATAADVARTATAAVDAGYTSLKVKLGMGDDMDRLLAVAEAIPTGVSVRLDANGVWPLADAIGLAERAASVLGSRLEYIEDPVASLEELEQWCAAGVAVGAVDELVGDTADLGRVIDSGLARVVVVKPALFGGLTPVLELASVAAAAEVDLVVSSLYDGPVGLSAWCHLAVAIGNRRAHGLGTASFFAPGTVDHLMPRRGMISL